MILGVDPGLANVGWALVLHAGGLHSYGHLETHKGDQTGDAAKRLAQVMYGLSVPLLAMSTGNALAGDRVVIEWPGGAGGFQRDGASPNARATIQTSTTAGSVYGAAYWLLRGRTDRILTPAPVSWRVALGKLWSIKPSEEAVHAVILEKYPQLTSLKRKSAPHILDAVGLALYGLHYKQPQEKRP